MTEQKWYTIGEFARLTHVTERALRFYDKKTLLKPSGRNAQGHRLYSDKDIVRLQKIVTLKYLDYTLEEIAEYLNKPELDLKRSLAFQKQLLLKKREHLDKVIETLNSVQEMMEESEYFQRDDILMLIYAFQMEDRHKDWLKQRLSHTTVDALFFEGRPDERKEFERRLMAIYAELKQFGKEGKQPDDPVVQDKAQELITVMFSYIGEEPMEEFLTNIGTESVDPILFPDFTQEEDIFLQQVFENMNDPRIRNMFEDTESHTREEGDKE
ncbi:MerR family transcriptional regulator [Paenibacillus sp. 32O-W]|uniref:MerR family transcriptional regulator n=1 Tax=Paenibacillus sp. 32O-W TaxID=1695218 RepID=UPI0011A4C6DF|nr:MerR family transcriptional regulator [Paenibacillus sp. 32O-W]